MTTAGFCLPGDSAGSAGARCLYRYGGILKCARLARLERGQVADLVGEKGDPGRPALWLSSAPPLPSEADATQFNADASNPKS